jgi:triosephosphate isomerase
MSEIIRTPTARKPLALSNWKMAMTVAESLAFVRDFEALAGDGLGVARRGRDAAIFAEIVRPSARLRTP